MNIFLVRIRLLFHNIIDPDIYKLQDIITKCLDIDNQLRQQYSSELDINDEIKYKILNIIKLCETHMVNNKFNYMWTTIISSLNHLLALINIIDDLHRSGAQGPIGIPVLVKLMDIINDLIIYQSIQIKDDLISKFEFLKNKAMLLDNVDLIDYNPRDLIIKEIELTIISIKNSKIKLLPLDSTNIGILDSEVCNSAYSNIENITKSITDSLISQLKSKVNDIKNAKTKSVIGYRKLKQLIDKYKCVENDFNISMSEIQLTKDQLELKDTIEREIDKLQELLSTRIKLLKDKRKRLNKTAMKI